MSGLLLILALDGQSFQRAADLCHVQGRVVDSVGAAVSGATVTVGGRAAPLLTNNEGRFCVTNPPRGAYTVTVRLSGFLPVLLEIPAEPGPITRDVTLTPSFTENLVVTGTRTVRLLDGVPVRTEVVGRAAIKASAARSLAEALRGRVVLLDVWATSCGPSPVLIGRDGAIVARDVRGEPLARLVRGLARAERPSTAPDPARAGAGAFIR